MGGIKVLVSDKTEHKFRKASMTVFGYHRGSLSAAAEEALLQWSNSAVAAEKIVKIPKDPLKALKSITLNTTETGVGLQHRAQKIRAHKLLQKA